MVTGIGSGSFACGVSVDVRLRLFSAFQWRRVKISPFCLDFFYYFLVREGNSNRADYVGICSIVGRNIIFEYF